MNSSKLRNSNFVAAAISAAAVVLAMGIAAIIIPARSIAQQQPSTAPQPQTATIMVPAPSWQKNAYWATVDRNLLLDFAGLARFHDADAKLGPPAPGEDRVVFMGDSITEGWNLATSFPGKPYVNRGIGGQTSSQMLLRFRQDVIDLQPKAVVILAGTNDLAENTGPATLPQVEGNLASMSQLAEANRIRVVLCSVLPSAGFSWHPELGSPASRIATLNEWIKGYAAEQHLPYVDYYSAMKDAAGGLPPNLSHDGVHPLPAGYAVMAPLAQSAIDAALKSNSVGANGSGR